MISPTRTPALLVAALLAAAQASHGQSARQVLGENSYIEISERILPAVANITIEPKKGADPHAAMKQYEDYFNQNPKGLGPRGPMPDFDFGGTVSGSAVLIKRDGQTGYLLTNNHVVAPYDAETRTIKIAFHELDSSGTEYNKTTEISGETVRIVGKDELSDLAVVQFEMPATLDVHPVAFADSDAVKIGEQVLALGNPLELNSTVTRGIVSAKSRYLGSYISLEKLLQTDAVIQPGNSGGPLVNLDGKIVGINNAIASRNGLWQGIGFAIPSNDAKRISDQLITSGRVMRGFLGIEMRDVRFKADVAGMYELDPAEGVFVSKVVTGGPAAEAGLHVGDVVVSIDGEKIRESDEMLRSIANKAVDASIAIDLVRLDEKMKPFSMTVTAKLAERPAPSILAEISPQGEEQRPYAPFLGEDLKSDETRFLGLGLEDYFDRDTMTSGLKVSGVAENSVAQAAGLQRGDVVTTVNGRAVSTLRDFQNALAQPIKGSHIIRYLRAGEPGSVTIEAQP